MATSYLVEPQTYTYVQYTETTITASPIPSLAATLTLGVSGHSNGTKTTTSEVVMCTPDCIEMGSDGKCVKTDGCHLGDFKPSGFAKQGETSSTTKHSGAVNLWKDPGARLAVAVLGLSWVLGVAMVKVF